MKYNIKNISSIRMTEILKINNIPIISVTTRPLLNEHILLSTLNFDNKTWTFLVRIKVSGDECKVEVDANKIDINNSIRYGGVEDLLVNIDTEDDSLYYFQELAQVAIINYIFEGFTKDKVSLFLEKYKI